MDGSVYVPVIIHFGGLFIFVAGISPESSMNFGCVFDKVVKFGFVYQERLIDEVSISDSFCLQN